MIERCEIVQNPCWFWACRNTDIRLDADIFIVYEAFLYVVQQHTVQQQRQQQLQSSYNTRDVRAGKL